MDQRRLLIAIVLSMAVMVVWQIVFPPPEPIAPDSGDGRPVAEERLARDDAGDRDTLDDLGFERRDERAGPDEIDALLADSPDSDDGPAETAEADGASAGLDPGDGNPETESGEGTPGEVADGATLSPARDTGGGIEATEERLVVLEGEGFRAELSNRGAHLVSYRLPSQRSSTGEPLDLVRARTGDLYPLDLVDAAGRELPVGDALFAVDEGEDSEGRPRVRFRYDGPLGRAVKEITLLDDGLLRLRVASDAERGWALAVGPGVRNPSEAELETRLEQRFGVYRANDELEEIKPDNTDETIIVPGSSLSWAGLEDTYFLTAILPVAEVDRVAFVPHLVVPAEGAASDFEPLPDGELSDAQDDLHRELLLTVRPIGSVLDLRAYFGAKDFERLSGFQANLEDTVRFGWFGFLAKGLLVGLKWIYENVVPNYGWAIVLMTLVIKIILLPLTHTSYKSMQKMQEVGPRMKEIRNRYKSKLRDKNGRPNLEQQRKMNEEIQAMYKAEGVNPLGGCLPMLLQFPVLLAFYKLLLNAVELRGAPWVLWIDDLSKYDPYFVLPIVMGAVQFLQQKLAPSNMEPMQRRIMMLMPIFFTVLFLKFPSGLVLYWLTNNVLTLIQQSAYRQMKSNDSADAKGSAT